VDAPYDFVVLTFNSSKKNYFGCAANKKIGKAKDLSAPLRMSDSSSCVHRAKRHVTPLEIPAM
jgi:hypothetical protein